MFKRLKKEPVLYKAHLAKLAEERARLEEELRREQAARDSGKVSRVSYRGTAQIGVVSMFHGCGATYLAEIIAQFFCEYRRGKTCLVETKGLGDVLRNVPLDVVTYPCELTAVYKEHYDFIVRDFGVFDTISKEEYEDWERTDFKCVVCWPDERSLSRLAEFVKNMEHSEEFIYFFNLVPKDRVNEILDIMVDYKTVIFPCTSYEKIDKGFLADLYKIFGKG